MVITITNADKSLIKIIETQKLAKPYEIISEIPTEETLKAIQECGKGKSKVYDNFLLYMQEVEDNA